MKTLIAAAVVMMVVFSFGTVYAIDDQMPMEFGISNIGPAVHDPTDWSSPDRGASVTAYTSGDVLLPLGPSNDIGVVLAREAAEDQERAFAAKGAKGAAAGGRGAAAADAADHFGGNWYRLAY